MPGRVLLFLLVGLATGWLVSEGAVLMDADAAERPVRQVELVIPLGTAEQVAAGQAPPAVPPRMLFVPGDTLVVRNEDVVPHELGPVWVPPGASGRLVIQETSQTAYSCSFRPEGFFGLQIRPRLPGWARAAIAVVSGLPVALLLGAYSLIYSPLRAAADAARHGPRGH